MSRNLKLAAVCETVGLSGPVIYRRIAAGVFPPPVKVGPKASRWPDDEVAAVNAAVAGNATATELRQLVAGMVAARAQRARAVLQATK